jgi:Na+-translocating ferredoxin:NAD+ oxidoreductase RnfG subunit
MTSRHKKACARIALMLLIAAVAYSCGALVNAYGEEQLPDGADGQRASAMRQAVSPGSSGARMDMRTIDVIAGDTLWSIAQTYKPASQDTREYVSRLKKANGLKSSLLYEGQVLLLP